MTGCLEMLHGVSVSRAVAASDIATNHAHSKLRPRISKGDTVFTNKYFRRGDLDLIEMRTFLYPESSSKGTSEDEVGYSHTAFHGEDAVDIEQWRGRFVVSHTLLSNRSHVCRTLKSTLPSPLKIKFRYLRKRSSSKRTLDGPHPNSSTKKLVTAGVGWSHGRFEYYSYLV